MRLKFFVAAAIASLVVQPAFANGIGRIKSVVGSALVERAGAKLPVKPGFLLEQGDTLITGKDGKVGITFNDDTRFATGANARVNIAQYVFDDTTHDGQFTTNIEKGKVAIVSGKIAKAAKDAMKVRTPMALLGVRGTRFVVDVR
jgi:hypothetical protein